MAREKDIVLIYYEDKPLSFARIERISPDIKKDWYHVKLLILQMPYQVVTWILRNAYINGTEFTMNGKRMRLEQVVCPDEPEEAEEFDTIENNNESSKTSTGSKVISLASRRKAHVRPVPEDEEDTPA